MRISKINSAYNYTNNNVKRQQRKTENSTSFQGVPVSDTVVKNVIKGIVGIAVAASSAAVVAKNADKIKKLVMDNIPKFTKKQKGYITIPVGKLTLDSAKLRALPKELKTKAIEELNRAMTSEDKLAIVRKYMIGSYK